MIFDGATPNAVKGSRRICGSSSAAGRGIGAAEDPSAKGIGIHLEVFAAGAASIRIHLIPITIESGPTRCSTRAPLNPASFIQPVQSAPV